MEFTDGEVTALTAYAIAKSIYSQCDADSNEDMSWEEFVDIKHTHNIINLDQQQTTLKNGITCKHTSMEEWFNFADGRMAPPLKESHPVHVVEWGIQIGIALEKGFDWCMLCVITKQDTIILLFKKWNIKFLKT